MAMFRMLQAKRESGLGRSSIYSNISDGTFPPPVRISDRAVGWPDVEIAAINAARIAGKTKDEIRELVAKLVAARKTAA